MNFEKSSPALIALFERVSPRAEDVVHKKMFGYPACFVNGNMFAGLHENKLIVRLGSDGRGKLPGMEGAKTFEPMPGRPMKDYMIVPEALWADPSALGGVLSASLRYARALPSKAKKPSKPKNVRR